MSSNEQWKSGGDCTKCRKKEYCNKACSQNIQRRQAQVGRVIANIYAQAYERMDANNPVVKRNSEEK